MCFSIIVGLGLDYDVFLVARVYEYRLEGTPRDYLRPLRGLCCGGHETGRTFDPCLPSLPARP